jgi:hypothetical protein
MRIIILALILAAAAPAENKIQKQTALIEKAAPPKPQAVSEEELRKLEERDEKPAETVAGGALSNEHLTYIVIALAAAVLVLVLK